MPTTIVIADDQCAAVFSNDGPPEVHMPVLDNADPEAEATPAMLQTIAVMYLTMHPERFQAIVDEAIEHMQGPKIVLPG